MLAPASSESWFAEPGTIRKGAACSICQGPVWESVGVMATAAEVEIDITTEESDVTALEMITIRLYSHVDCIQNQVDGFVTAYTEFEKLREEALARS